MHLKRLVKVIHLIFHTLMHTIPLGGRMAEMYVSLALALAFGDVCEMATSPCLHTTGFVNIKRSARWQRHTSGKYINGKAVAKHRSGSKVVGAFVATGCFSWLAYIYEQRKCNRKMGFRLLNICICEGKSARLSSFTRTFFPPHRFLKIGRKHRKSALHFKH